jgi:hypothetical protein
VHGQRLAVGFAALTLVTAGTSTAQAATSAARRAALSTFPVSCASATVWLRLTTSTGEHCYTGYGTDNASLVVSKEPIAGRRTVCLATAPA